MLLYNADRQCGYALIRRLMSLTVTQWKYFVVWNSNGDCDALVSIYFLLILVIYFTQSLKLHNTSCFSINKQNVTFKAILNHYF